MLLNLFTHSVFSIISRVICLKNDDFYAPPLYLLGNVTSLYLN